MSKTKLQKWMTANGLDDETVARRIGRSRVQISRIRRGLSFASIKTAMRLQQLTGVNWKWFVNCGEPVWKPKRKKKAPAPARTSHRNNRLAA